MKDDVCLSQEEVARVHTLLDPYVPGGPSRSAMICVCEDDSCRTTIYHRVKLLTELVEKTRFLSSQKKPVGKVLYKSSGV